MGTYILHSGSSNQFRIYESWISRIGFRKFVIVIFSTKMSDKSRLRKIYWNSLAFVVKATQIKMQEHSLLYQRTAPVPLVWRFCVSSRQAAYYCFMNKIFYSYLYMDHRINLEFNMLYYLDKNFWKLTNKRTMVRAYLPTSADTS